MAKRTTTAQRRHALVDDLTELMRTGALSVGDMLPPTRELAARCHLSHGTVAQELKVLVDQGVLRAVPRVGVFVVKSISPGDDLYVFVTPDSARPRPPQTHSIRTGFERRIAQLGGRTALLPSDAMAARWTAGSLPSLSGVLTMTTRDDDTVSRAKRCGVPTVLTGSFSLPGQSPPSGQDIVNFDDVDGGRQAARHLIDNGCRNVAFLGLHMSEASAAYGWSRAREIGWADQIKAAGDQISGTAYLPAQNPRGFEEEISTASGPAQALVADGRADGVVCANDNAALGLLGALRAAKVPYSEWPAVVGFDQLPEAESIVLTSLHLPWAEAGAIAADLLWGRRSGRLAGPSKVCSLTMTLIPRVSSLPAWPRTSAGLVRRLPSAASAVQPSFAAATQRSTAVMRQASGN